MLLRFAVPWVPTAKKNSVVIRTIRVGGRAVPKPVPSDRVRAEEHALSAIALVALGLASAAIVTDPEARRMLGRLIRGRPIDQKL